MNTKSMLFTIAAFAAVTAGAALDEADRPAVRKVAATAEAKLREASALDGLAITLLPVKGDVDGYCERLLVGAIVKSGKTCVVSNDEKSDERFKRILSEIKWDERQTTLKSIDPATADELGHLKSTQILLEARLDVLHVGRRRRAVAELNLLAYAVSTKQYVWSENITMDESGRAWPDPSEFNVQVAVSAEKSAVETAGLVGKNIRNDVAGYGYRVNGEGDADLELSAVFSQETFDKSGEYLVLKGVAKVRLASKTGEGVLYEKTLSAKGRRGLGEKEAVANLADGLSAEVRKWIGETLAPGKFFAKHHDFAVSAGR